LMHVCVGYASCLCSWDVSDGDGGTDVRFEGGGVW
jgi:hypothetical protein